MKGQALGIIMVLAVVVIAGGLIWAGVSNGWFSGTNEQAIQDRVLSSGDCETAPSITVAAVNKINKGTTVTTADNCSVNGVYVGGIPTNLQKGDKVGLMVGAADYINTIVPEFLVGCGQNTVPVELYATSTNTFRIFNTNNQLLTDAATATITNQSSSAAPISLTVYIDSTSDESTGDLVVVVESTNTTEVDDIVLSGLGGAKKTSVPEFYTQNSAGSIVKAFDVPQVLDGASVTGTLTLSPESGQTIGSGDNVVYVTAYSKEAYVDTDGLFKVGVEDSDGTTVYEDTWDYDFVIT